MAQEQFAGPEHYQEFDPEKFIRDMKIQADEAAKAGQTVEPSTDGHDEQRGGEASGQGDERG